MSDLPQREEIVARVREINGQKDPAAREDPEAVKAEQEEAARQQELQMREVIA